MRKPPQTIEAHPELPAVARLAVCGANESPRIVTDGPVVAAWCPLKPHRRCGRLRADHAPILPWGRAAWWTGRRRAARSPVNMWQAIEEGLTPAGPAKLIDLCIAEFCPATQSI